MRHTVRIQRMPCRIRQRVGLVRTIVNGVWITPRSAPLSEADLLLWALSFQFDDNVANVSGSDVLDGMLCCIAPPGSASFAFHNPRRPIQQSLTHFPIIERVDDLVWMRMHGDRFADLHEV